MTSLLKPSGEALAPLAWRPQTLEPPQPLRDPLVEALQRRVNELETALKDSDTRAKEAIGAAYAEGERAATEKIERSDEARLEALETGLAAAFGDAKTRVQNLETLALVLCENALAKIFDQTSDYREMVTRALSRQMSALRREMVMRILVSAEDFSSDETLEALASRIGGRGITIVRDSTVKAGACRIDLRLGHIDLSAPDYWTEVRERLCELAESEAP